MTQADFDRWIDHHCANFPGLRNWLDRAGKENQPDAPATGTREILDSWFRVLGSTDLDAAKAASDDMLQMSDAPTTWNKHPGMVRSRAGKHTAPKRAVYIDGEKTIECRICLDEGTTYAFDKTAGDEYRRLGKDFTAHNFLIPVLCKCQQSPRHDSLFTQLEDWMIPYPAKGWQEKLAKATAWTPPRHSEFDEWA